MFVCCAITRPKTEPACQLYVGGFLDSIPGKQGQVCFAPSITNGALERHDAPTTLPPHSSHALPPHSSTLPSLSTTLPPHSLPQHRPHSHSYTALALQPISWLLPGDTTPAGCHSSAQLPIGGAATKHNLLVQDHLHLFSQVGSLTAFLCVVEHKWATLVICIILPALPTVFCQPKSTNTNRQPEQRVCGVVCAQTFVRSTNLFFPLSSFLFPPVNKLPCPSLASQHPRQRPHQLVVCVCVCVCVCG